jgi:pyruvate,water dikinase
MIDLGGGLSPERAGAEGRANMEDIISVPLRALLKGMTHEDIHWHKPRPVDLGGFLSIMGRQMLEAPSPERSLGNKSYAIISDKYLNFSSRIGYHFCTIDSYCGNRPSQNYVSFRFKGGAADDIRRARRARAIGNILEGLGFAVDVKRDLINARIKKYEQEVIKEKLDMLGRLNLFTRQMDMLMASESRVDWVVQAFLEGNYDLDEDFQRK